MKRVAVVGADFTPSSLPPALRIRFLAQHLPEWGWQPTIISTDPRFYEWRVDPENARLLSESIEVIRTPALPARWARRIGVGDIGMRSLPYHWRAVAGLCREKRVDALLLPVPPSVPMILGRLAHLDFGIPYVVDYIDPWVTDYYWKLPRSQRPPKWLLAWGLARVLEPLALRKVAHITGVSKGTTDGVVARYPWLKPSDATEIPYGGEPSDFEYLRAHPRQNHIYDRGDGLLHLVYVGAFIPAMHLAARAIFQAVRLGLERSPALFQRVRIHCVGTSYAADPGGTYQVIPLAREMGIADVVDEHPARVAYLDSLQLLLDAAGLLVIGSEEPHYTASKIFPSIWARRPILAVFHEASSVVPILQETQAGTAVTFGANRPPATAVEEIYQALAVILTRPPGYHPPTRWEATDPYTASAMARRLAGVLDACLCDGRG